MLNLDNIAQELAGVSQFAAASRERLRRQIDQAQRVADCELDKWSKNVEKVNAREMQRLTARLLSPIPLGACIDPKAPPENYTALAVDGSSIPIDRHSFLPYYVINIGHVILHYGSGERPVLTSRASLHYTDDDILADGIEGEMSYKTETQIGNLRGAMEIAALTNLLPELENRPDVIAFIDGPLVLWAQDPQNRERRTAPAVADLCTMIEAAKAYGVLIAGYISRPGSREVISAIRIVLEDGNNDTEIDRLSDAQLFARILDDGQRTQLFESRARILEHYIAPNNRIGFFYLNTGQEIARVEVPIVDHGQDELTDRVHSLVLDQSRKGNGYPVALIEAHEKAVLRSADRETVERLIQSRLQRSGIRASVTRKSLSKRIRPI